MKLKILLFLLSYTCFAQVPAYYSNIDFTQSSASIKAQLTTLITNTHTTELVYTSGSSGLLDTWAVLKQSDLDPTNAGNVVLIYGWDDTATTVSEHRTRDKNESCHTSSCTGKWVREHTFPKSLATPDLGTELAGADAHNLRAVDAQRNNSRSNKLFGASTSSTASYSIDANSWYPGDEWIGDAARIVMYMYLRYPSQCAPINVATGNATFSQDMPDILLQWNAQDPPSDFENNRNNTIATNQGNRNPFIDNPYLATMIWNGPEASDMWNLLPLKNNVLENISIYPIITNDIVHITNYNNKLFEYKVFNALGQLAKEGTTTDIIDITSNSKGLYFINLQSENQSKIFKVILN